MRWIVIGWKANLAGRAAAGAALIAATTPIAASSVPLSSKASLLFLIFCSPIAAA
jgi:hypothetical protein